MSLVSCQSAGLLEHHVQYEAGTDVLLLEVRRDRLVQLASKDPMRVSNGI